MGQETICVWKTYDPRLIVSGPTSIQLLSYGW